MLCHYMLFFLGGGAYVGNLVGKVARVCVCGMANVGIKCYEIFEKHSWNRYLNLYTTLVWVRGVLGKFVLFLTMRLGVLNLE